MVRCLSLMICACLLPAAELVVLDLDAGLEWRPRDFDFTVTDERIASAGGTGRSEDGSDRFEYGLGLRIRGLIGRPAAGASWGPLYGLELSPGWSVYDSGSSYSTLTLRGLGGLAWQLDSRWQVQALALGGIGYGRFAVAGDGVFDDLDLDGWPYGFGARLGASYALSRSWRLNADLGWSWSAGELSGDGFALDIEESGLTGFLGIAWRFNAAPRPLD